MELFRFLFAPVLLAVAVLSPSLHRPATASPPARVHAAHAAAALPERDAAAAERDHVLRAAPTRPAAGP